MKKIVLSLIFLWSIASFAQNNRISIPKGFNYKALIVNNGTPLANSTINVKITIKDASTVKWIERHSNIQTDANGIVTITIGTGQRLAGVTTFNAIDWLSYHMKLKVEVDSGSGYTTLVNDEAIRYVPMSRFADNSALAKHLKKQTDYGLIIENTTGSHSHSFHLKHGTEDWYIYQNSTDDFVINNDGDDIFTINNTSNDVSLLNNLGIGTNSPGERINIYGNNNENILVETSESYRHTSLILKTNSGNYDYFRMKKFGNSASGTIDGIQLRSLSVLYSGATAGPMMINVMTNNPMYFLTDNHLAMTIEESGNIKVEKKIVTPDTNNANMLPMAYGRINSNGSITGGTGNYTISHNNTGIFDITFQNTTLSSSNTFSIVTLGSSDFSHNGSIRSYVLNSHVIRVRTYGSNGSLANRDFNFVIYKK